MKVCIHPKKNELSASLSASVQAQPTLGNADKELKLSLRVLIIFSLLPLALGSLIVPWFLEIFIIIYFASVLFLVLQRYWSARRGVDFKKITFENLPPRSFDSAFVSIHLPICSEPPELVKQTLDRLDQLKYRNFEVIVLDNNTSSPLLWKPIEAHCKKLGRRFRFFHYDKVEGHKAGALNICLSRSNPATEYCLILDADYVLHPQLLNFAVWQFKQNDHIGFLQFPQAYRNSHLAPGLETEYNHYFYCTMRMAEKLETPLSTGTLSFFKLKDLQEIGGWDTSSITEDALMGSSWYLHSKRGRYLHIEGGRGTMPPTYKALSSQRKRWVHGNAQVLFNLNLEHLAQLTWLQVKSIVLQLTAWFQFFLAPFVVLILVSVLNSLGELEAYRFKILVNLLCIGMLMIMSAEAFAFLMQMGRSREHTSFREALSALLVRFGLFVESNTAWWEPLIGRKIPFVRTSKFRTACSGSRSKQFVSFGLLMGIAAYLFSQDLMIPAFLLTLLLCLFVLSFSHLQNLMMCSGNTKVR